MDALPHQGEDRKNETCQHKRQKRHNKAGGPQFAAEHGLRQLFLQGRAVCRRNGLRCVHHDPGNIFDFNSQKRRGHPDWGDRWNFIVQARR